MGIKVIPLNELEADPQGTLTQCARSGDAFVVELPDHRLVSIQSLHPMEDDSFVDDLLASNPSFRAVLQRSKESPRRPFSDKPDA